MPPEKLFIVVLRDTSTGAQRRIGVKAPSHQNAKVIALEKKCSGEMVEAVF